VKDVYEQSGIGEREPNRSWAESNQRGREVCKIPDINAMPNPPCSILKQIIILSSPFHISPI
jgi:hypothetical protein